LKTIFFTYNLHNQKGTPGHFTSQYVHNLRGLNRDSVSHAPHTPLLILVAKSLPNAQAHPHQAHILFDVSPREGILLSDQMLRRSELTTLDQGDAEVQLTARLQEGISKTHANLQLLQRDLSGRLCLKMGLVLDRTRFITSWQGTVTAFCESIVLGNYTITERNSDTLFSQLVLLSIGIVKIYH